MHYSIGQWSIVKMHWFTYCIVIQQAIMLSSLHFSYHCISSSSWVSSIPPAACLWAHISLILTKGNIFSKIQLRQPITNYTNMSSVGRCCSDAIFTDHGEWRSGETSCHTFAVPAVILAWDQSLNDCFVLKWNKSIPLHFISLGCSRRAGSEDML